MSTIIQDLPPTDVQNLKGVRAEIKLLQQIFVIVPVDKTSHDLGLVCRSVYHDYLNNHIKEAFHKTESSQEDILKKNVSFNKKNNFNTTFVFPYLYATPKLHKDPVQMRPIVGTSYRNAVDCLPNEKDAKKKGHHAMTQAQQTLSVLLKAIIAKNKTINEETIAQHDVSWFFIVESSEEVALRLKQQQKELSYKTPKTYDFKNMYTSLCHEKLKKELTVLITQTFVWVANIKKTEVTNLVLVRSGRGDKKRPFFFEEQKNTNGEQFFTKEQLLEMVIFVLDTAYVKKDDLYRQTVGIPMGCTAAPDLANAFCLQIEKQFILDLIKKKEIDNAKKYRYLSRYIDDFLTFSGEPPPQELYGMQYCETCVDEPTVYLGMLISIETFSEGEQEVRFLRLGTQEKVLGTFKPIKYSAACSAQPIHITTGIMIGQLTRSTRITNNVEDLKYDIANIVKNMLSRGHHVTQLIKASNTFFTTTYRHFCDIGRKLNSFTKKCIHHYSLSKKDLYPRKTKVFKHIAQLFLKKKKIEEELKVLIAPEKDQNCAIEPVHETNSMTQNLTDAINKKKTFTKKELSHGLCPICKKSKLTNGKKITQKNIASHMHFAHKIHVFDIMK